MSATFKVGDRVCDASCWNDDGTGTVLEIRRSAGVYASGRLRPGTSSLSAVVEFTRPRRQGMKIMYGATATGYGMLTETYTRTIKVKDLVLA